MRDNFSQQDTTRPDSAAMARVRVPRIVIRMVAITIYSMIAILGLGLYVTSNTSSILLEQLSAAIYLGIWGLLAVYVACDLDRYRGRTLLEHILTASVCIFIGLAMYDCLAHVLLDLPLPTLEQMVPLVTCSPWLKPGASQATHSPVAHVSA